MTAGADVPELVEQCLDELWRAGGTDLLLSAGTAPRLRVDGRLRPSGPVLTADEVDALVVRLRGPEHTATLRASKQVDLAFRWRDVARLRGNAFRQQGTTALALRMLPVTVPSMDDLGLPPAVRRWPDAPRGLVLVTGPTGSGKSTTLASLVHHVSTTRAAHVVTLEDPVEYVHGHGLSVVNQREVGRDVDSFADGLRAVLREDPDVLLVGEMRDPESIEAALTIAETGHLVLATLHANDTAQAVDRVVDVVPAGVQAQVRLQLAHTLVGVLHQVLVPRVGGGRVAAHDVLVGTQGVRNVVREGATRQLRNLVAVGQRDGMQTLEASLSRLVAAGVVTLDEARAVSSYPAEVRA